MRTDPTQPRGGLLRAVFEADVLPRTHFNVDVSYYRDHNRAAGITTSTWLAQLHLYL